MPAPPNMPAPIPARLPFSDSSALASSTSLWTSRLVCSVSCLTSSAADVSCRADIRLLLVPWCARLVGRVGPAGEDRHAQQPVAAPPAPAAPLLRPLDLRPAADRDDRVTRGHDALLDAPPDRLVAERLLGVLTVARAAHGLFGARDGAPNVGLDVLIVEQLLEVRADSLRRGGHRPPGAGVTDELRSFYPGMAAATGPPRRRRRAPCGRCRPPRAPPRARPSRG